MTAELLEEILSSWLLEGFKLLVGMACSMVDGLRRVIRIISD
jgi:hypothetical protein